MRVGPSRPVHGNLCSGEGIYTSGLCLSKNAAAGASGASHPGNPNGTLFRMAEEAVARMPTESGAERGRRLVVERPGERPAGIGADGGPGHAAHAVGRGALAVSREQNAGTSLRPRRRFGPGGRLRNRFPSAGRTGQDMVAGSRQVSHRVERCPLPERDRVGWTSAGAADPAADQRGLRRGCPGRGLRGARDQGAGGRATRRWKAMGSDGVRSPELTTHGSGAGLRLDSGGGGVLPGLYLVAVLATKRDRARRGRFSEARPPRNAARAGRRSAR